MNNNTSLIQEMEDRMCQIEHERDTYRNKYYKLQDISYKEIKELEKEIMAADDTIENLREQLKRAQDQIKATELAASRMAKKYLE